MAWESILSPNREPGAPLAWHACYSRCQHTVVTYLSRRGGSQEPVSYGSPSAQHRAPDRVPGFEDASALTLPRSMCRDRLLSPFDHGQQRLVPSPGSFRHPGTQRRRRKTILLLLSSTKARLGNVKQNFSLETTANIHSGISKWISSQSFWPANQDLSMRTCPAGKPSTLAKAYFLLPP